MGKPAPDPDAPVAEHRKHAKEILDAPDHKVKPKGHPDQEHETETAKE